MNRYKVLSLVFFNRCDDGRLKHIIPKNHKRFHSVDEVFNFTLDTTDLSYGTILECYDIYKESGLETNVIECHFKWDNKKRFAFEPSHIYLLKFKDTINFDFNRAKLELQNKYKNCKIHIVDLSHRTTPHLSSLSYKTLNYLTYAISLDLTKNYNKDWYNTFRKIKDNIYINDTDFTIEYKQISSDCASNVIQCASSYVISYGTTIGNSKLLNTEDISLKYKYRDDKMGYAKNSFFNVGLYNIIPCLSFASSTALKDRHKYKRQ